MAMLPLEDGTKERHLHAWRVQLILSLFLLITLRREQTVHWAGKIFKRFYF
jgi:hypothetical protein